MAHKQGFVDGSGHGNMATQLIRKLRVDFGVQLDKGQIPTARTCS